MICAKERSRSAVYPQTEVQLCIVHLVRASLNYVPWKDRKLVAGDLRRIYRAATAEEGKQKLEELALKWKVYPSVSQVWRRNWECITPFFHYPADIRNAIYTTNSVEALHRSLRKIIKTRGSFPNEESALKLLFLAIRQASKKWTMPVQNWSRALNYFTVLWPERMSRPGGLAYCSLSSFLRGRKGRGTATGRPPRRPAPQRLLRTQFRSPEL
jgi:putative transposase